MRWIPAPAGMTIPVSAHFRVGDPMYTLYGMTGSGNCYKPALLMRQLGVPFQWVEVDILNGASRTPEFLARNPEVQVETFDARFSVANARARSV